MNFYSLYVVVGDATMHFKLEETRYRIGPEGHQNLISHEVYEPPEVPTTSVPYQPLEVVKCMHGLPQTDCEVCRPPSWYESFVNSGVIRLFLIAAVLVSLFQIVRHFRETILGALITMLHYIPQLNKVTLEQLRKVLKDLPQEWLKGFFAWASSLQNHPSTIGFFFGVVSATVALGSRYYYDTRCNTQQNVTIVRTQSQ